MPDGVASPTPVETIIVNDRVVACDGGVGALGHPRVWLRIKTDHAMCPYCSRMFVLKDDAGHDRGF